MAATMMLYTTQPHGNKGRVWYDDSLDKFMRDDTVCA